jgi:hypothetical protein
LLTGEKPAVGAAGPYPADALSSSVSDSGESIFARGEAALGAVKKAKNTLIEQNRDAAANHLGSGGWHQSPGRLALSSN